ncbi:MAG: urease accessory protein UreE [Verrucomicrobiaceae bacterium]
MALLLNRIGPASPEAIALPVARVDLWKRRWRATASDGSEIAVALDAPAKHGEFLWNDDRSFQISQLPETVITIAIPDQPDLAAKIGWYFGNRHIPIEVRKNSIIAEDFPTLTDSLDRIGIAWNRRQEILNCRPHSSDHRH